MDVRNKSALAVKTAFPPANPYDVAAWNEFYAANPGLRRSVGAAGDDNGGEGAGDQGKDGEGAGDANDQGKEGEGAKSGEGSAANVDELMATIKKLEDEKAGLLKDTMKNKDRRKQVEGDLDTVQSKLKELFGDVPLEDVKTALENQRKAEEESLRKAGEFDKLKERMAEEHKKSLEKTSGEYGAKVKDLSEKLDSAEGEIRRLLVSNSFAGSKFLADELTLTAAKAEKIYGDHFKVEEHEGRRQVVAYADGKPLVNAEGKFLGFEDAFKEIIGRDPEKEAITKSKAKPGAGSGAENKGDAGLPNKPLRGVAAIQAGLGKK